MRGGKHLLLLAAFIILARCQQQPKVSMSPDLTSLGIFNGDLFNLRCENSTGPVKWYLNDKEQSLQGNIFKVTVANDNHSGSYHCESNGKKSDIFSIHVLEYAPHASLTIKTGQPVMQPGASVILQLHKDDGLQGWNCWVNRGGTKTNRIVLRLKNSNGVSIEFQTMPLKDPETIFWCSDSKHNRSNQIRVRTSNKQVSLEMYPLPSVAGEKLTLRCLVWGTDQISHVTFYKDNEVFQNGSNPTYNFNNVTESVKGMYRCFATFKEVVHTDGHLHKMVSDDQDVLVQVSPLKAVLSYSANTGMSCSCPRCPTAMSYYWYHKKDQSWVLLDPRSDIMTPSESGTYACRIMWLNGRSSLSNPIDFEDEPSVMFIIILAVIILGIIFLCIGIYCYRKRNTTGPVYEDVPLRSRDKGDNKYETLHGAKREAEYDTLHSQAPGREVKEGMKEGVQHPLETEGTAGGEGGYQALKKEGIKEGVYHTLGTEGTAGGEGGNQALKKEGMKEGVYHTLETEGAAGGEGGYQALKKEEMKEGVYHTLGTEGAAGGEGGHEILTN